jgi:hypothetical protein
MVDPQLVAAHLDDIAAINQHLDRQGPLLPAAGEQCQARNSNENHRHHVIDSLHIAATNYFTAW